ncbi:MAG: MBL fold metallo-hydrolase [Sulfuricella sp.]|nr:MBL fold metallo-hydrolase [Sulfuricella sp.]
MKFLQCPALFIVTLFLAPISHALDMNFRSVVPGVYAHIGETGMRTYDNEGMNANSGFIVTDQGVVVVDSGSTWKVAERIHTAIRKVTTQPVKYVINTGGQDHRWLGNGYFKAQGTEIVAAHTAIDDMNARGAMQLQGLAGELKDKVAGTEVVLPTRTFEKREVLRLGDREIHLIHFHGGHTPGDSVVWLPKERVLFSGDMVYVDRLLGVLPFSNATRWLASFAEMETLQPQVIVPGHGEVCDLTKAQRESRDYLHQLVEHMRRAVDDMVDLQKAINSLDQSAWKHLANYDLLKGGNASRVYLEMESR